jgi:hypothetical protein
MIVPNFYQASLRKKDKNNPKAFCLGAFLLYATGRLNNEINSLETLVEMLLIIGAITGEIISATAENASRMNAI